MKLSAFLSIAALIAFLGCQPADYETTNDQDVLTDYPNTELLVSAEWLSNNLEADLRIVDMRNEGFGDGHIPGAVNFGGIPALHDEENPVEFHLIDADAFADLMSRYGIGNNTRVVAYDDGNGLGAARLFYALELHGHQHVHVLNGGWQAWKGMELPVSEEPAEPGTAEFVVEFNEDRFCDVGRIMEAIEDPNVVIFDARTEAEYRGEQEMAERSGRIPGAVNLEWRNMIMDDDEGIPFFLPADQIAEKLAEIGITPDKEVITHCHTNVRGSHAYFTLRLMGYDSVRAYEGSWSEYGNLPNVPIE